MNDLSQIIRQARRTQGYTQDDLAKYLGFSHRSVVQRLETGKLEIKAKDFIKLATLLNIDLNALKTK